VHCFSASSREASSTSAIAEQNADLAASPWSAFAYLPVRAMLAAPLELDAPEVEAARERRNGVDPDS
jgi:hypothetical protein